MLDVEKRLITDRPTWLRWRLDNVNASEAPCLFADELVEMVHPRLTAFELWAVKSGRVPDATIETPDARRGRMLEPVVLEMVAEDHPDWSIIPGDSYYFHPGWRIGGTPDATALRPDRQGPGNCQVKTANEYAWRKYWLNSAGEIEVPLYVAIQTSIEAFLTGLTWAIVAVLQMSEWKVHILDVEIVPSMLDKLRELVDDFWRRVANGDFYPPNWAHDTELIRRIFAKAERRDADLRGDNEILEQLARYAALSVRMSDGDKAEKERKELQAQILIKVQAADRALLPDGRILEAPTRRRAAHQVKEAEWRQLSVTGHAA